MLSIPSQQVAGEFNSLVRALATSRKLVLALLILSYLYHGLQVVFHNHLGKPFSLFWSLQLWTFLYFPKLWFKKHPFSKSLENISIGLLSIVVVQSVFKHFVNFFYTLQLTLRTLFSFPFYVAQ